MDRNDRVNVIMNSESPFDYTDYNYAQSDNIKHIKGQRYHFITDELLQFKLTFVLNSIKSNIYYTQNINALMQTDSKRTLK